jgi:hypothetical protein
MMLSYIFCRAIVYDTTAIVITFLSYSCLAMGLYIYDQNVYPILDSVYGKDCLLNIGQSFEEDF